jgi:hypothetical protein
MLVLSLIGCLSTPPSSGSDPVPLPSPPGTTSSPQPTSSPIVLPCSQVTGTRSIWLFSRQDPSLAVLPADPPDGEDIAYTLVGPDALGRLYLLDGQHVLRRSDDQGCSWQQTAVLPDDYVLLTSSSTEGLYTYRAGELLASDDGGATFTLLTTAAPGVPVAVSGGSPDELRANSREALFGSTDGGLSWISLTTLPIETYGLVQVDPTDLGRAVFEHNDEIWQYDGTAWVLQLLSPYPGWAEASQWKDGVFLTSARNEAQAVLLRSETGAAPFVEIDWGFHVDDQPHFISFDGDQHVVAGYHNPGLQSESTGPTSGLVVITDGVDLHRHLPEGMSDAKGIAFTEDLVVVALTPQGAWQQ